MSSVPLHFVFCVLSMFLIGNTRAADLPRITPLNVDAGRKAGFTTMPAATTGISFSNVLARARSLTNSIYLNGSGVAAGDVDGDGWCDLYFCGLDGPNRLYKNLRNWKFQEVSNAAGAACEKLDATGAAFADLDDDLDLDLVVNSVGGGTHVFFNDGRGAFSLTQTLNPGKGGTSLALADVDGNGMLDLYVANYRTSALMDMPDVRITFKTINSRKVIDTVNGRPASDPEFKDRFYVNEFGRVMEAGEADALYLNAGGKFTAVSWTGGAFEDENGKPLLEPPLDWALSAIFHDLNNDGRPDLYVCNDFDSPDRVWINQGQGKFRALPLNAIGHTSLFSMGVDVADINRDGHDDIFVLDMLSRDHRRRMTTLPDRSNSHERASLRPQYMMNTLQLNRGDGTFAEIAQYSGVAAAEWAWACIFLDVDLDGFEDLLITNGNEADGRDYDASEKIKEIRAAKNLNYQERMELRRMFRKLDTANIAFRNRGDLTFEDASAAWHFDSTEISNGMCLADLDNDGDMDAIINNLNGPAQLLRNDSPAPRVAVRLHGHGIGAKMSVTGGPVIQTQEMIAGGRYLSSDQAQRAFAAGEKVSIEALWPSGRVSKLENIPGNSLVEIFEPADGEILARTQPKITPMFENVSALLGHTHVDEAFDDFERQPLLPRRLSQLGPGVAWIDLNGDGFDELLIGAGKGGQLAAFQNVDGAAFKSLRGAPWSSVLTRDATSIVIEPDEKTIYLGLANYEDGLQFGPGVKRLEPGASSDLFSAAAESAGPLALADVNRDGVLDLFVGARCVAGKYPGRSGSKLYLSGNGSFKPMTNDFGSVSAATFADLNDDGVPDLITATEFGTVRAFSEQKEIAPLKGLWNAVATGDFNNDGRMDIVAANWGPNCHIPKRLYALDADLIEADFDPAQQKVVPARNLDVLSAAIPALRDRFKTHTAFAAASVQEILGEKFSSAREFQINCLDSMVFLNRGERFEAVPLPAEAQLSAAFGISVADFDGDGNEDIFLAQNFFGAQPEVPRSDAGLGLILIGDGAGRFRAHSAAQSGIRIFGEQRGCATSDFNNDGRIDLAVGVNSDATQLFQNTTAKPGLRVRFEGPCIGARLRLGDGPVREIQAGTGLYSQNSPTPIFPATGGVLSVRLPNGKIHSASIPLAAKEVIVSDAGIRVARQ